jgi:hypothetical protein
MRIAPAPAHPFDVLQPRALQGERLQKTDMNRSFIKLRETVNFVNFAVENAILDDGITGLLLTPAQHDRRICS